MFFDDYDVFFEWYFGVIIREFDGDVILFIEMDVLIVYF